MSSEISQEAANHLRQKALKKMQRANDFANIEDFFGVIIQCVVKPLALAMEI